MLRKQQKYMAKYGQYGMGGGYFANDMEGYHDTDYSHLEFNAAEGQQSNTLGLIHPGYEGKDIQQKGS